jgi:hypothetical protein
MKQWERWVDNSSIATEQLWGVDGNVKVTLFKVAGVEVSEVSRPNGTCPTLDLLCIYQLLWDEVGRLRLLDRYMYKKLLDSESRPGEVPGQFNMIQSL